MDSEPAIVIVTKAPDPTRSKTRLKPLPPDLRRDLSAAMIQDTLTLALSMAPAPVIMACDPGPDHPFFQGLKRLGAVALVPQPRGDLGERLAALLGERPKGCIFLGSDCPHLPRSTLKAALEACAAPSPWDGAMAPAEDGGYVLIGLKPQGSTLLRGIPWSTPAVAEATRRRALEGGLSLLELPSSFDIDEPKDLQQLIESPSTGRDLLTCRVLRGSLTLLREAL